MTDKGFLEKESTVKGVLFFLYLSCVGLLIADPFVDKSHIHFPVEGNVAFYGAFGFVVFVLLVLVAKHILRPLVMRKEDYYD